LDSSSNVLRLNRDVDKGLLSDKLPMAMGFAINRRDPAAGSPLMTPTLKVLLWVGRFGK
jgi:hypothetical protein